MVRQHFSWRTGVYTRANLENKYKNLINNYWKISFTAFVNKKFAEYFILQSKERFN